MTPSLQPDRSLDQHQRPLGVLRLSLTARCNFSCPYCLPDGQEPEGLLTLKERLAVVGAAVGLGVTSLRLTGGEPLLNRQLEELVEAAQPLRQQGLGEIALTSNGSLLDLARAQALRQAGLDRLTLSLDGTTAASVAQMAGLGDGARGAEALKRILAAIDHAKAAGFDPACGALKLNAVVVRGRNDDQLLPLAQLARQQGVELRLIEAMDVGTRNGWSPADVMPAAEMVQRVGQRWPLEPLGRAPQGTAQRWRYGDGQGHLAVVASISAPFCGDCNRLRITADGQAYTCLFASQGTDLRPWLRREPNPRGLSRALERLWRQRQDRYSEERQMDGSGTVRSAAEMAYLGG